MNDESVDVWAKSNFNFPELTSFTICTWVRFSFEVKNAKKHKKVMNPKYKVFNRGILINFGLIAMM